MYTFSLMLMFYVKLFMKYGKASLFSMAAILNIATNCGSIKISGCFHQHSEKVWHGGHLCQMSCFCPDVNIYYIKSPHYKVPSPALNRCGQVIIFSGLGKMYCMKLSVALKPCIETYQLWVFTKFLEVKPFSCEYRNFRPQQFDLLSCSFRLVEVCVDAGHLVVVVMCHFLIIGSVHFWPIITNSNCRSSSYLITESKQLTNY